MISLRLCVIIGCSLAGMVATELERDEMEGLLLRFHESIVVVDCDVLVCNTNSDGTLPGGCDPDDASDASAATQSAEVALPAMVVLAIGLFLG
jgi:hypothetical protein